MDRSSLLSTSPSLAPGLENVSASGSARRAPWAQWQAREQVLAAYPCVLGEATWRLPEAGRGDVLERKLLRGTVENLRQGCQRLNGAIIKSGEIFSLRRQLGRLTRSQGFVAGIDLVPAAAQVPARGIGCGLSALSHALLQAAKAAGLLIIEDPSIAADRAHDLRFAAPEVVSGSESVVIEARMNPYELVVRVRSTQALAPTRSLLVESAAISPFGERRTPAKLPHKEQDTHFKTAALLDRYVSEFEAYLNGEVVDLLLVPSPSYRYRWRVRPVSRRQTVWPQALLRAWKSWRMARGGATVEMIQRRTAEMIALAYARRIPVDTEHLIVAQEFLPYLWRAGVMQGRSFDVLLTRAPLNYARTSLQSAAMKMPDAPSLQSAMREICTDERWLIEAESEALVFADKVLTPHEELAGLFPNLRKLSWTRPVVEPPADVRRARYLLLPASLTVREGGRAALAAADELDLPLLVTGDQHDDDLVRSAGELVHFIQPRQIPWHEVAAVVHPTLGTTWPRLHLKAQALDVPVVCTPGCGIEEGNGVSLVSFGDEDAVLRSLARALHRHLDGGADGVLPPRGSIGDTKKVSIKSDKLPFSHKTI